FIPVQIQHSQRLNVRELFLYASYDRGHTWALYERAAPGQFTFDFFAPRDGLYYFTVVVVHHDGRQEPPDVNRALADVKIHVDSTKPHLELNAVRNGKYIDVAWAVMDRYLSRESVRLSFCVLGWKNVPQKLPTGDSQAGQTRFEADPT